MEQTKTSILLNNGDFFDFNDPFRHEFDIKTIAHALSHVCRYTGHSDKFYSVAEHSVLVSRIVPESAALAGLLHDASEAFCGDVSSPLKALLPEYKKIEEAVQEALFNYFNLSWPMPRSVHVADKQLYKAEREQIATGGVDNLWHTRTKIADVVITGMQPKDAKAFFLSRFNELTALRQKSAA